MLESVVMSVLSLPYHESPSHRPVRLLLLEGGRNEHDRLERERSRQLHRLIATSVAGFVLVVVCSTLLFSMIAPSPNPPSIPAVPTAVHSGPVVVVQQGDTLTSIARDIQPRGDITSLINELARRHGPATLLPGDRISVTGLAPRG